MFHFLTGDPAAVNPMGTLLYWVVLIAVFGLMFYFMAIRPQKKQQKKQDEMMASIAIGDSVLTTAGFYGIVIDIVNEEVIIIEFGNNKNCRIPMRKSSVVEIEKPMEENKAK